jgi:hypothetical protein
MAEPEEVRTWGRSSPVFQEQSNLLFLHITWIFYSRDANNWFGEIFGLDEKICMFFYLFPWNPIVFSAGCKT